MHYEGSFEIRAPIEKVYDFVTDPRKLTSIFPDVSDMKMIDERSITLKAKVGMSFVKGTMDAKLEIAERKPQTFARVKARGTGLNSYVDLENVFTLEETANGGTVVRWAVDATVSGLIASVGSRLVDLAAKKYVDQIISSMKKKLS